jgi:heme a synthase
MLDEAAQRRDRPALARVGLAFALLAALTWALIVLGALVRAHGAGLACPDWPLCFGEFVPQMNVRVAFEYFHRVTAGSVTLCFAALAWITWRLTSPGDPVRRPIALVAALLALQILLGALTVWHLLASWTVTSHLIVGNSIAATLAWIALTLRERAATRPPQPLASPAQRRVLCAAIALLAVQLVLGGLVSSRYAGLACPEWPTCNGGFWFPSWRGTVGVHLLHRTNGYLLLAALAALAIACRGSTGRLGRLTRLAAALGVAQVIAGVANVLSGIPVELTGLHSALAAALVLTLAGAAHAALRSAKPGLRRP